MDGNAEAFEIIQMGSTQMRYAGMGGFVGMDYNALRLLADSAGIETPPAFWKKVRAVEEIILKQQKKDLKK